MILEYPISKVSLETNVNSAIKFLSSGKSGSYMACANPHSLVVASKDPLFKEALKNADILLPDGIGIILAAKLLSVKINKKIAGYDFFFNLTKALSYKENTKYYFLGSSEHVLNLIVQRLSRDFPYINICGTYSPPFKNEFSENDNQKIFNHINSAKPDILWVGMTAPKQEKWIFRNREKIDVPFIGAIGAVFDFYAGTRKRSSIIWQKAGLEWLPRFLNEPDRLYKRNLISTPIFLFMVIKELFLRNF